MMFEELTVDGVTPPRPDGDLEFRDTKVVTEYGTEAGTTLVNVRRGSRLTVTGSWTLTGPWMARFREWAAADTVTVCVYHPDPETMTPHTCRFGITSERHAGRARERLGTGGLYRVSVKMEEL